MRYKARSYGKVPGLSYFHTQRGWLGVLLGALSVFLVTALVVTGDSIAQAILGSTSLLMLFFAASFHSLTVEVTGEVIKLRFGPLPVFQRTVRLSDILKVAKGQTSWLDGWGIHYSIGGGWLWNVWGRVCVVLSLKHGKLRIGSDDPVGLVNYLRQRTAPPSSSDDLRNTSRR